MFDFGNIKTSYEIEEEERKAKPNITLNDFLSNIDSSNYAYYENLSEEDKKLFVPYTALRWVSALDDSISVTYKAKDIEDVFGKWTKGGKEVLNELKDEMNSNKRMICTSVSKYEHNKYDWRIKFSASDSSAVDEIKKSLIQMGIHSLEVIQLTQTDITQYELMLLNDLVNSDLWDMQKHPELVYRLMCSVQSMLGTEGMKRTWIPFCKGMSNVNKDILNIFKKIVSPLTSCQLDSDEYRILLSNIDVEKFKNILLGMGYEKGEITSLSKIYKAEIQKHVYEKEIDPTEE